MAYIHAGVRILDEIATYVTLYGDTLRVPFTV